jgi:opacity protein-like surface antigen
MKSWLRGVCAAVAISAALVSSANAADMYVKARPAPLVQVYNWTGFYVGAHVGYQSGRVVNDCPPPGCPDRSPESFFGGVQAGFNYQTASNWVLGAWVNVPIAQHKFNDATSALGFDAELKWAVAAGGRIGYAFDRWLPYVLAGVVVGEARAKNDLFFGGPGLSPWETHRHVGYTVGAGLEYAIDRNWSAFGRYAYVDFEKVAYPIVYAPNERFGFTTHTAAFGVNYRFGSPVVAKY